MNPGVAGLLTGGVVGAYAPMLRDQIRHGRIDVPIGGINPIGVRRDQPPLAYRACATAMVAIVATLLVASIVLIVRALLP